MDHAGGMVAAERFEKHPLLKQGSAYLFGYARTDRARGVLSGT
jgi:hypothetical protein